MDVPEVDAPIGSRYLGAWNWGAFLLAGFWLFWHKRVRLGILYWCLLIVPFILVLLIPGDIRILVFIIARLLFFIFAIGITIWLGRNGNRIAMKRHFESDAQFVTVEQRWATAGFILWGLSLSISILNVLASTVTH